MSSHWTDFNTRNKSLTAKLLQQGYRYHKPRKAFSTCYRRHFELVSRYNTGLRSLLQQGVSEPEFYGDSVYKFRNRFLYLPQITTFTFYKRYILKRLWMTGDGDLQVMELE